MPRPKPGTPIMVEIGGKDYELKFPLKVMRELETKTGISLLAGLSLQEFQNPHTLATLLFYGLKTKNTEVTEEWLDDNVDGTMLIGMVYKIGYACTGRWREPPTDDEVAAAGPEKNAPSPLANGHPGLPSGPLDATTSISPNASSGT